MTTGQFIKEARLKAGLSQKNITDAFGWHTAQFCSNFERNIAWPPLKHLPKLSKLLGVSPRILALHIYEDKRDLLQKEFSKYL